MKFLTLLFLALPLTSFASEFCSPAAGKPCGLVESRAIEEAYKAGLQNDINEVIKMETEAKCVQSPSEAVRTRINAGNHGKLVSVMVLTELKCESNFFVANPIHKFPIYMTFWSSHDETEVASDSENLELKKLY